MTLIIIFLECIIKDTAKTLIKILLKMKASQELQVEAPLTILTLTLLTVPRRRAHQARKGASLRNLMRLLPQLWKNVELPQGDQSYTK